MCIAKWRKYNIDGQVELLLHTKVQLDLKHGSSCASKPKWQTPWMLNKQPLGQFV